MRPFRATFGNQVFVCNINRPSLQYIFLLPCLCVSCWYSPPGRSCGCSSPGSWSSCPPASPCTPPHPPPPLPPPPPPHVHPLTSIYTSCHLSRGCFYSSKICVEQWRVEFINFFHESAIVKKYQNKNIQNNKRCVKICSVKGTFT